MPGPCPLGCALVCPPSAATRSWPANPVGPATSFARGMLRVAGVGLCIDGLDQAVYRVPDTLLDLWAFGPDGVQVQLAAQLRAGPGRHRGNGPRHGLLR